MNFNNFTTKSQEVIQQAIDLVQKNGQQVIETPHLLKALMLKGEDVLQFLFGKLGVSAVNIEQKTDKLIEGYPRVSGGEPYLGREINAVLQKAIDLSSKTGINLFH